MIFGKNILPKEIARWKVTEGSITTSKIELQPGGVAEVTLNREDIPVIPSEMQLILEATPYTSPYEPGTYFYLTVIGKDPNTHQSITCPIIHSENGFHRNILSLVSMEFSSAKVIIKSDAGITINSWHLAGPAGEDTSGAIEEIRGELPRLLHDYNKARFMVKQKETTIALISAFLMRDTSLNGHLQVTYTATEDCTLIIRVKDNDVSELFTPILYDIKRGRGSIGIPHAYMEKKIGIHTFTATAQVTNGTLYFETRSILYTIDGGNLAERIMDVGMDVRDIAIRRTAQENNPTWIYAIGIDDGKALVKARPYSDVANTAWEPRLLIGEGKEAAIAFNGDWAQDENGWRLNTDNDPWIFWVDAENILWAQYFDDETTKIQLASDVVDVSVVMGWRNPVEIAQDQGMIASYVKSDGKVYYRNYCIFDMQTKAWDYERAVVQFEGLATSVYMFRTNDYRVGLRIQDASGNSTVLLTARNWAGMASPAENIATSITDIMFEVTPIAYHDAYSDGEHIETSIAIERFYVCPADVVPEIVGTERLSFLDKKTIQVMFNYALECELDNLKASLALKSTTGQSFTIDTVEENGNALMIKTVEEMPVAQDVILTYSMVGSYYLAFRISSTCLYDYGSSINLTIDGVPPVGFAEENLSASVTGIVFDVTQVYYSNAHNGGENLEASIADISFVVTKVGNNPL